MGGGPLGAKYRSGERLPSEEEAQETETQMFRCPSQSPEIISGVSPISTSQHQSLRTHCPSVSVLGEGL